MKIAVIGSGISGLSAAYFLSKKHDVWLFEQNNYVGGHSHTVKITDGTIQHDIDTGFIVCNKQTYPNFIRLLELLKVELQETQMGLGIKSDKFEFAGNNLNTIFAQRKNLSDPNFWRMLFDIYRFNKLARKAILEQANQTLEEFLQVHSISQNAQKYYVLPLVSAIWSTGERDVRAFPVRFLFQFLDNHGLLTIRDAPQWYTIKNGSKAYIDKLTHSLERIELNSAVRNIIRNNNEILLQLDTATITVDKVILAVHSDEVLPLLEAPSAEELQLFGSLQYQPSSVILHTDTNVLAKNKRAWASWNYWVTDHAADTPCVTYNMNILQNIRSNNTYCVSLNLDDMIAESSILGRYNYSHPIYDKRLLDMQKLWHTVNKEDTYYCGAYWRNGFHEDGLVSALRVVSAIDREILCKTEFTLDL